MSQDARLRQHGSYPDPPSCRTCCGGTARDEICATSTVRCCRIEIAPIRSRDFPHEIGANMTLLLSNDDAHQLLAMPECMAALVESYRATHEGTAINGRRSDMVGPGGDADSAYVLKMMGAVLPQQKVGAIRLNSDLFRWVSRGERKQRIKVPAAPGERWVGLVLLFSTETGEPLAIFPDGVVQRARVGATSGIALDHLARKDANVLAMLGSGWQAEAQVLAAASARRLREIHCYSPNAERCRDFAARMAAETGVATVAAA